MVSDLVGWLATSRHDCSCLSPFLTITDFCISVHDELHFDWQRLLKINSDTAFARLLLFGAFRRTSADELGVRAIRACDLMLDRC